MILPKFYLLTECECAPRAMKTGASVSHIPLGLAQHCVIRHFHTAF